MAHEVNLKWLKGRFVHWVVHMLYTIRKKFYLEKVLLGKKFYLVKVLLGKSYLVNIGEVNNNFGVWVANLNGSNMAIRVTILASCVKLGDISMKS